MWDHIWDHTVYTIIYAIIYEIIYAIIYEIIYVIIYEIIYEIIYAIIWTTYRRIRLNTCEEDLSDPSFLNETDIAGLCILVYFLQCGITCLIHNEDLLYRMSPARFFTMSLNMIVGTILDHTNISVDPSTGHMLQSIQII